MFQSVLRAEARSDTLGVLVVIAFYVFQSALRAEARSDLT